MDMDASHANETGEAGRVTEDSGPPLALQPVVQQPQALPEGEDRERMLAMARRTIADGRELRPGGTKVAYKAQIELFEAVHSFDPPIPSFENNGETGEMIFLVTEGKVYQMAWHTAYRKIRSTNRPFRFYTRAEWVEVWVKHPPDRETALVSSEEWVYVNKESFDHMVGALVKLAQEQAIILGNQEHYNAIKNSARIKALREIVVLRAARLREINCKEKLNMVVKRLELSSSLKSIEEEFWAPSTTSANGVLASGMSPSTGMVALRNRTFYLCTLQGLIRGESMEKACFSDLIGVEVEQHDAPHPYHVMIMEIRVGKVNQTGEILLGRVIRHKDVTMCAIGSLGMYLMMRFMVTNEDDDLNFTENADWFHVKLMVKTTARTNNKSNTIPVKNKQFETAINRALHVLQLWSQHAVHFGRNVGSIPLDLAEVDPQLIRQLGNWIRDVFDKAYSADLPLPAMRVAAGFLRHASSHVNPRTLLKPRERLRKKVFPFIERARAALSQLPDGGAQKETARRFLGFLDGLRDVILQDAACMMLEGRTHILFECHPVFQSEDFVSFKEQMEGHLSAATTNPHTRPMDDRIDEILPTVGARFGNVHSDVLRVNRAVDQLEVRLEARLDQLVARLDAQLDATDRAVERAVELAHTRTMMGMSQFIGQRAQYMGNQVYNMGQEVRHDQLVANSMFHEAQANWTRLQTTGAPARAGFTMPRPRRTAPPPTPRDRQTIPYRDDVPRRQEARQEGQVPRPPTVPDPPEVTYRSAREAYNDWHARFDERDRLGAGWRRGWSNGERKRFCRLRVLVKGLESQIERNRESVRIEPDVNTVSPVERTLCSFDIWVNEDPRRGNLSAMVKRIKVLNTERDAEQEYEQEYQEQERASREGAMEE